MKYNIIEHIANLATKAAEGITLSKSEKGLLDDFIKRQEKAKKKFNETHMKTGSVKALKKGGGFHLVPIHRFVGWEHGKNPKYSGKKLAELRRKQTAEAIKNHKRAGFELPVAEDRIVDSPAWIANER